MTAVTTAMTLLPLAAQEMSRLTDSLQYRAETQATIADCDHTPLWLNANRYGLSAVKGSYAYLRGALQRPLSADDGRRWGIGYGADVAVATGMTSTLVVQQAYIEARWLKGVLTLGAKEQPMELKNPELSSGSQTLGINARPVPAVRMALPDYWTVPGTNGWIAVKGHASYGKTTDGGWQKDFTDAQTRYIQGSWLHTKAGYLRLGPKNITLEAGIEMACQFGGETYHLAGPADEAVYKNGQNIKAFWKALVPLAGQDATDDVYTNVEGNHLGSWLMRLNMDYATWNLGVYADHFFEDQSSMFFLDNDGYGTGDDWNKTTRSRFFLYDLKDMLLGVELRLKNHHWLDDIVVEYLYTKYQSGPVYHDHTTAISEHISGKDDYYNHSLQTGWQHWGMVMGNPLYRSPLYNDDATIRVKNNRFTAWHLGLSGTPVSRLHYRLLATWQRGYGTYHLLLHEPQENVSLMGEASYRLTHSWQVKAALGMDHGKLLGDNLGCQVTLRWEMKK